VTTTSTPQPLDPLEVRADEQLVNAVLADDFAHALLLAPPHVVAFLTALADTGRRVT
jgi:hypothetical protein